MIRTEEEVLSEINSHSHLKQMYEEWEEEEQKVLYCKFVEYISEAQLKYKVGFDSCTVSVFINHPGNIDLDSLDTCEGARWSAHITPDMKMLPCSFDNQEQRWAVDLSMHTIKEAWASAPFQEFRDHLRNACPQCERRNHCMGGCPIRPEIVLCEERNSI